MTRPLARLGEEAERIASGDLDLPVADVGRDEVGRLGRALESMRAAGLEVDGVVGHHHPIDAVSDVWDPKRFDSVIVSTLPGAASTAEPASARANDNTGITRGARM